MIGLTTTVPVEIILAAGYTPVDMNNIFMSSDNPALAIDKAEDFGFPGNSCGFIKGIFSSVFNKSIKKVIAPVWGDCSNTHALCQILKGQNIEVIEFAYPWDRRAEKLKSEMERLCEYFGIGFEQAEKYYNKLKTIRQALKRLDDMTVDGRVTGEENFSYLISSSDFNGDTEKYMRALNTFLQTASERKPGLSGKRLAILGVPPIFTDLHSVLSEFGAQTVYNEVVYEFAMIRSLDIPFVDCYINYTYPYGMENRLKVILPELKRRKIDGVVHYTQCFCFRQIEDILLRQNIDIPVLTIEGDRPGPVDARTRMRIENFMELL